MRHLLHPFEVAWQAWPDAPREVRRSARTVELAESALDREYGLLCQHGSCGELLLIDHDHQDAILQRRPLPQGACAQDAILPRPPLPQGACAEDWEP